MVGWQRYQRTLQAEAARVREGRLLRRQALSQVTCDRDREVVSLYYHALRRVGAVAAVDPDTWVRCLEELDARPPDPKVKRVRPPRARQLRLRRGGRRG